MTCGAGGRWPFPQTPAPSPSQAQNLKLHLFPQITTALETARPCHLPLQREQPVPALSPVPLALWAPRPSALTCDSSSRGPEHGTPSTHPQASIPVSGILQERGRRLSGARCLRMDATLSKTANGRRRWPLVTVGRMRPTCAHRHASGQDGKPPLHPRGPGPPTWVARTPGGLLTHEGSSWAGGCPA